MRNPIRTAGCTLLVAVLWLLPTTAWAQKSSSQPSPAPVQAPRSQPSATSAQAYGSEMAQALGLYYQKKFNQAIPHFQAVLKRHPQHSLAMAYLLDCYYRIKKIHTVINKFEDEAVSDSDPTIMAQLGMAYFLRGMIMPNQLGEATTEFKEALKANPQLSMAYTGLGMVYFQKRMMPLSKGYFIRALRINPHDVMALDRLANIILVNEKRPADAMQLYQRCISEIPTYPDGYYYIGSCLFSLKRYNDAVGYLLKARQLDPYGLTKGFDAASLLGDTYVQANHMAQAIQAYKVALKMDPKSEYVAYKLKEAREGIK